MKLLCAPSTIVCSWAVLVGGCSARPDPVTDIEAATDAMESWDAPVSWDAPERDAAGPVAAAVGVPIADAAISCAHLLPGAGLSYHLLQSADGQSWDYDPPGAVMTRVFGSYDRIASTFSWEERYHASAWQVSTSVSGTGGIDAAGNESVFYTTTLVDAAGQSAVWAVIQQRTGCDLVRQSLRGPEQYDHSGNYGASGYSYTDDQIPFLWLGDGEPSPATGTLFADGTYQEHFSAPPGPDPQQWASYGHDVSGDASGVRTGTFGQATMGDLSFSGSFSTALDGSRTATYHADSSDAWRDVDYTVDYGGTGGGTIAFPSYDAETGEFFTRTCPLSIAPGTCTIACTDGLTSPTCNPSRILGL